MSSTEVQRYRIEAVRGRAVRSVLPVRTIVREPPPPPKPTLDPQEFVSNLQAAQRSLGEEWRRQWEELVPLFVELAFGAAEAVLQQEVDRSSYELEAPLREVLERHQSMLESSALVVRVHPDDATALAAGEFVAPEGCRITADANLTPGSFSIEGGSTQIFRSLKGELARVRQHCTESQDSASQDSASQDQASQDPAPKEPES